MARVLVIEDDTSMREMLSLMLGALGHDPVEASSCTAAQCHQAETPCDLILVDLAVGEGLRELHEAHPHLPILAAGSRSAPAPEAPVLRVANPFDLGQLHDSVERALGDH